MIINSSAHRMPLADGSVNCIVTSPPYFGLRAYAGNQLVDWPAGVYSPMAGVPACVEVPGYRDFDEYSHCEHEWSDESFVRRSNDSGKSAKQSSNAGANGRDVPSTVLYCSKCGAMRCGLGNEPTPEAYVWHMLLVMRECYRVLRDDGVMWFNIADSYADDTKWGGTTGGKHVQGLHGEPVGRARTKTGLTGGNLTLIPERILMAAQADGWTVRSIVTWHKSSTMPESVKGWRWEMQDGVPVIDIRPGERRATLYYDCRWTRLTHEQTCTSRRLPAKHTDAAVWRVIDYWLTQPIAFDMSDANNRDASDSLRQTQAALRRQRGTLDKEMARLVTFARQASSRSAQAEARKQERILSERIAGVDQQIVDIERQIENARRLQADRQAAMSLRESLAKAIDGPLTFEHKRAVIEAFQIAAVWDSEAGTLVVMSPFVDMPETLTVKPGRWVRF